VGYERTTYYGKEIVLTGISHGDGLYIISSGMVDLYQEEVNSPFWILTHGGVFWFRAVLLSRKFYENSCSDQVQSASCLKSAPATGSVLSKVFQTFTAVGRRHPMSA
jgi:hypothetical protein